MLSFAVNTIAPPDETPVPFTVIGSATVIPPEILKAAPEVIEVAPEVDPKLPACAIYITPAEIVVTPL